MNSFQPHAKKDEAPLINASGIFSSRFVGAKSSEAKNPSHSFLRLRSGFSAKEDKKNIRSNYTSPPKLALGISLLILGSILLLARENAETNLSESFENEPVKVQGLSENEIEESKLPKKVVIPDLSIDLPIKKANIINGYWEVFEDSAAWGLGSGIPGEIGNQVIFAHAREGLFLSLQSIKVGTDIYILTDSGWFQYEVKDIKEVYPSQTEVINATEDETLTLYTCSGYKDSKRLIVIAKRIKIS